MTISVYLPRILLVTPVTPFSSASGSEQRSSLMLAALTRVGIVDVLQLKPGPTDLVQRVQHAEHVSVLAETTGSGFSPNRYKPKAELTNTIESCRGRKLSDYQLIVGRYIWPVCQLQIPDHVPVVVDLDDFRYRYAEHAPWTLTTIRERLVKAGTHFLARKQLHRFSGAFVLSAQDQQEVEMTTTLPTVFLPNVPYGNVEQKSPIPQLKQVLFVGSLWYRPNIDGVNWYLKNVWPKVLATLPDARLTLVGAAPPNVRAAWAAHPGVSAPGFVDDLAATYRHASLVVVPIHSGGGTNIKVLEALAHNRPCLVTDFVAKAFAGYLSDKSEILVARDVKDFVTHTLAALRKPDQFQHLADAGHLVVQRFFSTELFGERVADFARKLLNVKP